MFKKSFIVILLLQVFFISNTVEAAVPSAITNLKSYSLSSSVGLTWTAPSATPAITDYEISYRTTGSVPWTVFADGVSTTPSATVAGLTNETSYQFRVRAINSDGTGSDSNIETMVPLALRQQDDFESYALNSNINGQGGWTYGGQPNAQWNVISGNGGKVVEVSGTADGLIYQRNNISNGTPTDTNSRLAVDFYADIGVTPQLWLRKAAPAGDVSGYLLFGADNFPRVSAKTFYFIKYIGGSNGTLNFVGTPTLSPIPLTNGTYYTTEFETINVPTGVLLQAYVYPVGGQKGAPFMTYIDTSSTYSSGFFGVGTNFSYDEDAAPYDNMRFYGQAATTPLVPQSLSAVAGNTKVKLNWNAPSSSGGQPITDYLIEYKLSSSGSYTTFSDGVSTTTNATVTGLTNGQSYDFRVSAINTVGTGPSATISGTPALAYYYYIASTGQSLSTGAWSEPALSTSQPYNNLMFDGGVEATGTPLVPLIESGEGENGDVETPSSGIANSLRASGITNQPFIVGLHGSNGLPYSDLAKGTGYYSRGMTQATNARDYVDSTFGGTINPVAITVVHGENDYFQGRTASYESNLVQWQADYQSDVNSISGESGILPMFQSQMNIGNTGELAVAQLSAHKNNAGKIILVGPKYQYNYFTDNIHLTNIESKHLGEMYAKVIKKVVFDGQAWNPLMPTNVVRHANKVRVYYNIPVGPLVIDTTTVAQRSNYGFEFSQTGGNSVSISNVQLVDNNTAVEFTLSAIPTGTNQKIRYAWTCPGAYGGYPNCGSADDVTRIGGNIRDSDTSVSPSIGSTNLPLYNWGVTFDENLNLATTPTAPLPVSGTANTGNVMLSWNTPSSNGGFPITDYLIEFRPTGTGTWTTFNDGVSTTTSTTVSGLSSGVTYEFRVAAINVVGTGSFGGTIVTTVGGVGGATLLLSTTPVKINNETIIPTNTNPQNVCLENLNAYLKFGSKGKTVEKVQEFLINQKLLTNGYKKGEFDLKTVAAVKAFQQKYSNEILKPWGLKNPTGYWYKTTRKKANELLGCFEENITIR